MVSGILGTSLAKTLQASILYTTQELLLNNLKVSGSAFVLSCSHKVPSLRFVNAAFTDLSDIYTNLKDTE